MSLLIKNNIVSFDLDGTLDHHFGNGEKNPYIKETRDFVLRLIRRGYEVYIVTRRYGPEYSKSGIGNEHLKVYEVAEELGIPKSRVIFTNRKWKYSTIDSIGACMHVDDDEREKYWIERHLPNVEMVWLGDDDWSSKIIAKIETHDSFKIWIENEKNLFTLFLGVVVALTLALIFLRHRA